MAPRGHSSVAPSRRCSGRFLTAPLPCRPPSMAPQGHSSAAPCPARRCSGRFLPGPSPHTWMCRSSIASGLSVLSPRSLLLAVCAVSGLSSLRFSSSLVHLLSLLLPLLLAIFPVRDLVSLPDKTNQTSQSRQRRTRHARKKKKKGMKSDLARAGLLWPDLRGMDKYEIKALEFLEHGRSSLLGICGMRGVGKSTLLWLVHTYCAKHPSFNYVIHFVAGPGFTVATLQGFLARNIGLGQTTEVAHVNMISSFLRDKTFLVLLDDLHYSIDLAAAGLPMPLGRRQMVIFTTRSQPICAEMGCLSNTIRMECLEEDDAWDLFKYNVGDDVIDFHSEIKDLAKKIVIECRGFPYALCAVGRSMSLRTDVKDWRVAYDLLRVKVPPPSELQHMDDNGYPCLQFFEDEF